INQDIKVGDIGSSQSLNRYAYCEGNPVSLVDPFGLSPQGNTGGTIWDILKRELNIHDVLGLVGIIPVIGVAADLIDAGIYLNEGEPLKAALSIVCAIPEIGDIIGIVRKGTELARVAKVVSTSIRTAQKFYVTAASVSAALDLAGDAKLEYAVNGGNMTSSVKAKIGAAALMAGLAAVSGKSMMKDVRRMARMADIRFKTTRLEMSDAASGKKIRYGGVGGCFVAGTLVNTAEGEKNIEEVQEGDYVLAENPETGEQGYRKVVRTFIREKYTIIHVFIGSEEIETTEEHPFYVEGVGFVPASELRAGDIIRTSDVENLPIDRVETEELEEPVLVYNFEVEDFHTYYVSGLGVLVHNTCMVESGSTSINPNEIRFSQSSVNGANEIINSMKANGWKGEAIDVVTMADGKLTTLDNTRVLAARYAGIDVQAKVHAYDELLPDNLVERFTTPKGTPKTWGEAVSLRIGKQNSKYRSLYPQGSNITGWSGN
ncbi:MAG: hypothetical protein K2I10_07165, partial [Lachnospiraceae bacterium]|nr:hypothetical protein [Lachnospiraceae bacterium]